MRYVMLKTRKPERRGYDPTFIIIAAIAVFGAFAAFKLWGPGPHFALGGHIPGLVCIHYGAAPPVCRYDPNFKTAKSSK